LEKAKYSIHDGGNTLEVSEAVTTARKLSSKRLFSDRAQLRPAGEALLGYQPLKQKTSGQNRRGKDNKVLFVKSPSKEGSMEKRGPGNPI